MIGNINSKLIIDAVAIQGEEIETIKKYIKQLSQKSLTNATASEILSRLPFKLVDDKVVFELDVQIGEQSMRELIKTVNTLHGIEDVKEISNKLDLIEESLESVRNNLSDAFVDHTASDGQRVVLLSQNVCFQRDDGAIVSINDMLKRISTLEELINTRGDGVIIQMNQNSNIVLDTGETVTMNEIVQTNREVSNKCSNIISAD